MPVGQQFSDWNSIDNSQPGVLGAIAAYGIDKSGLKDFLNGKKSPTQSGVGIAPDFTSSYAKRQGIAPAQPMLPMSPMPQAQPIQQENPMQMNDPFLVRERQIKEDEADHDAAKGMLNISGWSGDEFGTSGADKMATLMKFMG